jgi:hypothetical protein
MANTNIIGQFPINFAIGSGRTQTKRKRAKSKEDDKLWAIWDNVDGRAESHKEVKEMADRWGSRDGTSNRRRKAIAEKV